MEKYILNVCVGTDLILKIRFFFRNDFVGISTLRQKGEMEGMQGERWNWNRYTCVVIIMIVIVVVVITIIIRMMTMMIIVNDRDDDDFGV